MFLQLVSTVALFAEADGGAKGAGGDAGSSFLQSPFPLLIVMVLLFYFIILRPQRREQARRTAMLSAVKKNDRVVTAGGIYGIVTNVNYEADEVTVKVDETTNTKLRLTLSSISRVVGDESTEESPSK